MLYGLFDDFTFGTYDVNTGERRSFAPGALPDTPISEATSSDGTLRLLGFRDGHAVEYETSTGRVLQTVQVPKTSSGYQSSVDYMALSADHSRIYVSGQGLHSFDAASGDEIAQNNDGAIGYVAVGPSGVVIASSYDGSLGIFDPDTLAQQGSLTGARGYIQQTAFSDDGTLLLAGGNDGRVLLFDLESRTRLGDPIETGRSHAISLRSNGHEAAIGFGVQSGVGLWSLEPDHWVTAACAIAGRNLTTDEWSTYVGDLGDYQPTCPEYPAAETGTA